MTRKPQMMKAKSFIRHLQWMKKWNYPQINHCGVKCDRLDYCHCQIYFVSYLLILS